MKYLVIFVYFERVFSAKNIEFFIKNGLYENDDVDYLFIINGKNLNIEIPTYKNVNILKRPNIGGDFAGWAFGLNNTQQNKYDRFIFLNDTVRGPYLPRYIPIELKWYSLFSNLLSDKTKLVGTTKNFFPWGKKTKYPHIQSMAFSTDKIGLNILTQNQIFLNDSDHIYEKILKENRKEYIRNFELGMSKIILQKGYNIKALYLCEEKKIVTGDVNYIDGYFGITLNPLEVIFIKSNRINDKVLENYSAWLT